MADMIECCLTVSALSGWTTIIAGMLMYQKKVHCMYSTWSQGVAEENAGVWFEHSMIIGGMMCVIGSALSTIYLCYWKNWRSATEVAGRRQLLLELQILSRLTVLVTGIGAVLVGFVSTTPDNPNRLCADCWNFFANKTVHGFAAFVIFVLTGIVTWTGGFVLLCRHQIMRDKVPWKVFLPFTLALVIVGVHLGWPGSMISKEKLSDVEQQALGYRRGFCVMASVCMVVMSPLVMGVYGRYWQKHHDESQRGDSNQQTELITPLQGHASSELDAEGDEQALNGQVFVLVQSSLVELIVAYSFTDFMDYLDVPFEVVGEPAKVIFGHLRDSWTRETEIGGCTLATIGMRLMYDVTSVLSPFFKARRPLRWESRFVLSWMGSFCMSLLLLMLFSQHRMNELERIMAAYMNELVVTNDTVCLRQLYGSR